MNPWELWKKSFDQWEETTAKYVEQWMKSPLVLGPGGAALSMAMKAKAQADKNMATFWGSLGLPTKRDQERTLHLLNQLQGKIIDLEEQLADARAEAAKLRTPDAKA